MDKILNPFVPGAGINPPELTGRDTFLDDAQVTIERAKQGKFGKSFIAVGLRGVGQTVLLRRILTIADVEISTPLVYNNLDTSFFRVRFDRLTRREKQYLRAIAELGPGSHKSGEIASKLEVSSHTLGPCRAKLISKGMIYSPSYGDTAFTVPLFDEYMKRTMPFSTWHDDG